MLCFFPKCLTDEKTKYYLERFHQPQNCRTLFDTWKPIVEALDRHYNTNQRQFGCFLQAIADLIGMALPMFDAELHYSKEPISYCTFLNVIVIPMSNLNAVLLPVVNPVHGAILQVKAVRPLKAGEMVRVFKIRGIKNTRLHSSFRFCAPKQITYSSTRSTTECKQPTRWSELFGQKLKELYVLDLQYDIHYMLIVLLKIGQFFHKIE